MRNVEREGANVAACRPALAQHQRAPHGTGRTSVDCLHQIQLLTQPDTVWPFLFPSFENFDLAITTQIKVRLKTGSHAAS